MAAFATAVLQDTNAGYANAMQEGHLTERQPGYLAFAAHPTLNFMLNRLAWEIDDARLFDIGARVATQDDFVRVVLDEARRAEDDGRRRDAAFLYRGAEFFMAASHPDKEPAYERFMELFYEVTPDARAGRREVEFGSGSLGVIDLPALAEEKDVLLFCSGYDGVIEELCGRALRLRQAGYRVVLYEGPGQGAALRRSGLPMTPDWERPTSTVLDALGVPSCTLLGISLGSFLAARAAAFDSRVRRLVCWGAIHDFAECVKRSMGEKRGGRVLQLVRWGWRRTVNRAVQRGMAADAGANWAVSHGMHVSGRTDPFGYLQWMLDFHLRDVAHQIAQDVLVVSSSDDHLVPRDQLRHLADALVGARSVATRLTTAAEHAAEHCQIGNPDLVVDEILRWMAGLDRRDRVLAAASTGGGPSVTPLGR